MVKITVLPDCSKAPQKQLLRDLNIAFARADVEAILDIFSEDMRWQIVGGPDLRGQAAARQALEAMQTSAAAELVIHSIIIQGREGAVNGLITSRDGKSVAFCDICRFSEADSQSSEQDYASHKIASMMSYAIELPQQGKSPCKK